MHQFTGNRRIEEKVKPDHEKAVPESRIEEQSTRQMTWILQQINSMGEKRGRGSFTEYQP